jgi:hypothetical protein
MPQMTLFCQEIGYEYFQEKNRVLKEEIDELSDCELQSNDDSLKIILKAKHTIQPIAFGNDYRTDKGEIKSGYQKGRQIAVHLPFSGNKELFFVQPSKRYLSSYPYAELENNEVIFIVSFYSGVDTAEKVKQNIDKSIQLIKDYAGWLNENISSYNNSIDSTIENGLIARRKKLAEDEAILGTLNVQKQDLPSTGFVKPEKKIALKILENKEKQIDPALEMETYNEIIQIINNLGINLERVCPILRDLGEVPLRDTIWLALNTYYKGMASTEAFNKEGKTDILIRYQEKNIFIAECKIWSTESNFTDGIAQLLSYLTWRDSKTSYIIFSKNKDVNNVIAKAKTLIETNPHFISIVKEISTSCITYRFKLNSETITECFLTMHIFDLGSNC